MKELIRRSKIVWLLLMAVFLVTCEDDDDANLPMVVADFVHSINEDTGSVTFINLSENADSFTWDFGDGTSSTEINPIKNYPTGTYSIVLTAENAAGGSATAEDQIVINIPLPINFPINFDDPNVNYDVTTFNGAAFAIVANPDPSGANTSTSQVGEITNSGAAFEGLFFDLGTPLDLSTLKTVKMKFWSNTPVDILLKLEQGTGGDVETVASHGGTGWEEIFFTYDSANSYSRFTLFVDGPGTTAGTFYFDDVEQTETPTGCTTGEVAATSLPLDFESCETFPSSDNFGSGITSSVVENPFQTGINTSEYVLQVDKTAGADFFAGIQNTFASNFDLTTTNVFKLKVYSTKANVVFRFELALNPQTTPVTGNPAPVFVTIPTANEWTEVEFTFTGLPGGPTAYNQLVIKPDNDQADSAITEDGTYYLDDLTLNEPSGSTFDDGLLTNGDFEAGADPWTIGVGTDPVPVVTDGGNTFYSVDVTAAGNPFDVNMTQKLEIVEGSTYKLTFDAWSDRSRSIVAGIGLSGGSFANTTETVNITDTRATYELTLTATGFGAADARVLFDSGAEIGLVNIDNVSLFLETGGSGDTTPPVITLNGDAEVNLTVGDPFTDPGATATDDTDGDISGNITVGGDTVDTNTVGTYVITYNVSDAAGNAAAEVTRTVNVAAASSFDDGLLTNGDFEAGADPWTIGVGTDPAPIATDAGNTFYSADVTAAGNAFDVNVSQKLEIVEGSTYKLTFDAWSDRSRSIIAGIGLSGGSFASVTETVNITDTRTTYELTLVANGVGAADSRVLFDNGAEIGLVNIDNVSLFLETGGADTTPPVITLNGDATVELTQGDPFTDPGATATDNVDGDISGNIVVGGDTVDTNTVGSYVITYDVSDAAGNAATQVTRTVNVSAPAAFDDGLLTNGDFEAGADPWTIGVGTDPAPIATDAGNTFYSVDVTAAGNAFDVNVSQKLEIVEGSTYKLTFDAWSDRSRSIIAGIGLSGGSFASVTETVNITDTRATYELTLVANGVGAADSRVLFDNGAEVGLVNIDNVSLFLDGGGSGGCTGPTTDVASFPVNFENCEGFNVSFGSNQSRSIVDNPFSGGINTSDKVYEFIKLTGADGFGGFQNIFDFGTFTNNSTITFKVYSTLPNQEIRLEIVAIPNDGSIGNPAPYAQTLTTANEWVEMSFDLSANVFPNASDETVYTMLVVKPGNIDPGTTPADVTFYFDDFSIATN